MLWEDYLALEVSRDGVNFEEIDRFNESRLGGVGEFDARMSEYKDYNYELTPEYFTDVFRFRLRWVSDGNHSENQGCNIDSMWIDGVEVSTSPGYAYYSGTSMAAPHVAGLAGLLWSQKPELTYLDVKDIILTTGDNISSLGGKTVTGKRINAFNALDSLMVPVLSEITLIPTPTNNVTPQYTFNSTKAGAITYEGSCFSVASPIAVEGENVITFDTLDEGVYSDCKIIVTDEYGNISNELLVSEFTIDTTASVIPTVVSQLTNNVLPVISGSATSLDALTVEVNGIVYVEGDGNLVDNGDDTWSLSIPVGSELPEGSYGVLLILSDAAGNVAMSTTVNEIVIDTTIPVIILNGDSIVSLNVGDSYTEQGATATDNIDGEISKGIIIGGDVVDVTTPGIYIVTYNVVDVAGNDAEEVTRIVTVTGQDIPVITLVGDDVIDLIVGDSYTEQGATCTDNVDVTCTVVIGGDVVNTNLAGTYVVTYNAIDEAGNEAEEIIRTVRVANPTNPVITLIGEAVVELLLDEEYIEEGASAIDGADGNISEDIVIGGDVVDTSVVETYVITYNVTDSDGEEALEVSRTVIVVDEEEEDDDDDDDKKSDKKSEKKTELERPKKPSAKCYDDYVKIKWGDRSHGEDGYKIRRRVVGTKEWTKITATDSEKEYSYKDRKSLKPGVTYEWKIRAYRKDKRGEWSRKISCTMPSAKVIVKKVEVKEVNIEQVKIEEKKEIQEEIVEINEEEMKVKSSWMRKGTDKILGWFR